MRKGVRYLLFFASLLINSSALAFNSKRLIVTFKKKSQKKSTGVILGKVSSGTGEKGHGGAQKRVRLDFKDHDEMKKAMDEWEKSDEVKAVEEDIVVQKMGGPISFFDVGASNLSQQQWAFFETESGVHLPSSTASLEKVVVAVVDTGVTNHRAISERILDGMDFISLSELSNDGDGVDTDASDPGDWIDENSSCYGGQFVSSSWHGTHVAGIINGTDDSLGVRGTNIETYILPVRVLGSCGGYLSDVAEAIKWAAGFDVEGASPNLTPAKVINLSLGGQGACPTYLQEAIDIARSHGAVVVVAAGNENLDISVTGVTPANCRGVVSVMSHNQDLSRSYFSNYSQSVSVSSPGGTGGDGLSIRGILSSINLGRKGPEEDGYKLYQGTSMATAFVSAVAAGIKSVNQDLSPDQVEKIIRGAGKSFVSLSSVCDDIWCQTPLLNFEQSLASAQGVVAEELPPSPVNSNDGQNSGLPPVSEEDQAATCGTIGENAPPSSGPGSFLFGFMTIVMFSFLIKVKELPV
jgi:serine protease